MNAITNSENQTLTTFAHSAQSLQQRVGQIELAFQESSLAEQRIVAMIESNARLMEVDQEMTARCNELDLTCKAEMDELTALQETLTLERQAARERNEALKATINDLKTKILNLQGQANALVSQQGINAAFNAKFPNGIGACTIQ